MVRMNIVKRAAFGTLAAAALLALAGCPSPFLAAIKQAVANAPFTGSSYRFVRQWGNPNPPLTFMPPQIVKTDPAGYVYVADASFRVRKFTGSGNFVTVFTLTSSQGLFGSIDDMAFDSQGDMFITNTSPQVQEYDVDGNFVRQWGSTSNFTNPYGIAIDNSGNEYVVDGAKVNVQVFDSFGNPTATWNATSLGTTAWSFPHGIATDGSSVYILDSGNGRVIKAGTTGSWIATWTSATMGTSLGTTGNGASGISVAGGNVYIADTVNSRIVELNASTGAMVTSWGSAGSGGGQFTNPNSVAIDTSGYAYVADAPSNGADGRVQKFNVSSPVTPVAIWGGAPGSANGVVDFPEGITFDSSGNVYVSDSKHDRMQKFDSSGNYITQWGSTGTGPGQFKFSSGGALGIGIDSKLNRVYVPDNGYSDINGNGRVQEFDTSGNFIKVLCLPGSGNLQVNSPESVTVDSAGNVYIADNGNYRVEEINSAGYWVRNIGLGNGSGNGQFITLSSVAVDSGGNVYTADFFGNAVQKFDANGNFVWRLAAQGSGNGQFELPFTLTMDAVGNVYIADLGNRRIEKLDTNGAYLGSISGSGISNGGIGFPAAAAVDASGNLAISDVANNAVEEFAPTF